MVCQGWVYCPFRCSVSISQRAPPAHLPAQLAVPWAGPAPLRWSRPEKYPLPCLLRKDLREGAPLSLYRGGLVCTPGRPGFPRRRTLPQEGLSTEPLGGREAVSAHPWEDRKEGAHGGWTAGTRAPQAFAAEAQGAAG